MNTRLRLSAAACALGAWLAVLAGGAAAQELSVAQAVAGLKSGDEAARLAAIDRLAALGPEAASAVTPLAELLQDDSPAIRARAAHALGKIGHAAAPAAPALIPLLADPDEMVRRQVVAALPQIHADRRQTIPVAVKLLEDSDPGVRLRVMQTIASGGAAAVPALVEALGNERAAYWACLVLRDIGPAAKDAIPALTKTAQEAPLETRREAILALAAMRGDAASAVPTIVASLDEEHLRLPATYALGAIGQAPADAQAKLRENVTNKDAVLALTSLWALARCNPADQELHRQAVTRLVEALASQDAWLRRTASGALVALKPKPEMVVAEMERSLKGADEAVAQDALAVLGALGPAATPAIVEALKHERIRADLARILGKFGPEAAPATAALAKLIDDPHPRVVNEAILALAAIGPGAHAAAPRLAQALQEGDGATQHVAAFALGKIGPAAQAAQPALVRALSQQDPALRVLCAWALVQVGGKSAATAAQVTPVLSGALKAPLAASRKAAAEALGELGPLAKDAVPALRAVENDEDPSVRDAAAQALEAIGAGNPGN